MLWFSLSLLIVGGSLLVPDLIFDTGTATPVQYTPRTTPSGASASASLIDPGAADPNGPGAPADDAPQRLDVRGNEIARPVARYRVDEHGTLYEIHSPQTEVPRLKPPVM